MIGRLDGPFIGRRHDAVILKLSNLLNQLERCFVNEDGTWFTLYGDPGYSNQKFIKTGYRQKNNNNEAQINFNRVMSSLRVSVEYGFGKILQLFAFVDLKKNQKLLLSPVKKFYIVVALFTNIHSCLRGNQVAMYFNCETPILETYLQ